MFFKPLVPSDKFVRYKGYWMPVKLPPEYKYKIFNIVVLYTDGFDAFLFYNITGKFLHEISTYFP